MTTDGTPWRPLVHALDIAKAIRCALDAPREVVHNEVFNVGSNEQNYQVREIAETVARGLPRLHHQVRHAGGDNRSYKVNFDKIHSELPGLLLRLGRARAAPGSSRDIFTSIDLDAATFTGRGHTRLKQLEHLMRTKQIDADLFWTTS